MNNCDPCSRVLETLLNIQVAATRCERFLLLLQPQQLVRSQSLPALAQSSSTCGKDHLDITILLLGSPRSLPKTKWPLVWQLAQTEWPSLRKTILLNNIQGDFFNWSPPQNHKFFESPKKLCFFSEPEKNRVPRVPKKTLFFSRWSPPSKSQVFFSSWTLFFFEPFLPHVWDSVFFRPLKMISSLYTPS